MGYLIVLAMLVLALAGVLVAILVDGSGTHGRTGKPPAGTVHWLALTRSNGDEPTWAHRLIDAFPSTVESHLVEIPAQPLHDLRPFAVEAAVDHGAAVVAFWTALDDVVAGVRLEENEHALDALLADLAAVGATAVVGNVPDLSRLRPAVEAGLPVDELQLLTNRWNGAIARLAHHHGALVVDLFDVAGDVADCRPAFLDPSDAAISTAVAERIVPVLNQAIAHAVDRGDPAGDIEPL